MMPLYMPKKVADRFLERFLKSTLRLGDEIRLEGFLVRFPDATQFRRVLWKSLSPAYGDFEIRALTPFPQEGFPLIPVLFPSYLKPRGIVGAVDGRVHDLSLYSGEAGRFVIADSFESMPLERYLEYEKPGIHAGHIEDIFDATFAETAKDVFLAYFLSSPIYLGRVGGSAVTLLNVNSRHYAQSFGEIYDLVNSVHSLLRKDSFKVSLRYDSEVDVTLRPAFKIRYDRMSPKSATKFYATRRSRVWEKSVVSEGTARATSLISSADVPFIPVKEEARLGDPGYFREYSLDIGLYVFFRHLERPELSDEYVSRFKDRMISRIEREFPDIVEAMRLGIVMDMADVNGMGEHAARVVSAMERFSLGDPVDLATDLYVNLFDRIDDVLGNRIRRELASMRMKSRRERIINRVLWELNVLRPEGWSYEYFESKMRERGIERVERVFRQLLDDGIIIMKRKGVYTAVGNL